MSNIECWSAAAMQSPQRRTLFLKPFEDYFSDEAIIHELCRFRVKVAQKRNEALFLHRISSDQEPLAPGKAPEMFPPRRQWKRFRPLRRQKMGSSKVNLTTLKRAVDRLRSQQPKPLWAKHLEDFVAEIQMRALGAGEFAFRPLRILAGDKDRSKHEYRPIAVFELQDRIVDSLTARYFRENLDSALSDDCLAFRCVIGNERPAEMHEVTQRIQNLNRYHRTRGMFVAECDIKGFFDCVAHDVATDCLNALTRDARRKDRTLQIDERAMRIFKAYLDAYSFPRSVAEEATVRLRKSVPEGHFKWPKLDLETLYSGQIPLRIGIPQGGALSCFIANAVLHSADKAVRKAQRAARPRFTYLRYCDDMIVLAPSPDSCAKAYDAYRESLIRLKLPCHQPEPIESYGKDFWGRKSKAPYHWTSPNRGNVVPWVQFLGYQIRYDGMLRVRLKSLKKHLRKLTAATDELLKTLNPGRLRHDHITTFADGVRRTRTQILHRFRQKLISLSVGRRRLGQAVGAPMPLCWTAGFRGLNGQKFPPNLLKILDRHRERQIKRIVRRLRSMPEVQSSKKPPALAKALRYYGFDFSYFGQLRSKMGIVRAGPQEEGILRPRSGRAV